MHLLIIGYVTKINFLSECVDFFIYLFFILFFTSRLIFHVHAKSRKIDAFGQ